MYVPFDELPADARVWVYQCSRALQPAEAAEAEALAQQFLSGWQAHGTPLRASAKIAFGRFLVLGADQAYHAPSGCSIDASVAFVKQLELRFNASFFERTQIPFRLPGGIETVPLSGMKAAVASGKIGPDTPTFNPQVGEKADLETRWEVPAANTWLSKYF
jgi:hypothetical protein